ncbi:PAS domain-containing protein [Bradyrhizobium sp. U87765 SZCCT0131]|uniref:cell cycle histidine kinase CckA n=1 Tax=unclassified Bradyrhizobium TaxID=2631580 RepID=UPI001BAD7095|nr:MULTISPECIES: PAS domain-containing protein [unclassified Bradyrhizobium]MBR1219805.1 PAS domain-containing protein [Bradyrhizobium sp. U87765 SZCCT0131]MBR1262456.1 PAS domain-containing protein [Bradyrhizobium sp. U87765 SZCCT0134]MBR1308361.1 PAS domain-containing protein [Bradyrhizobium sp. U87765 SZCCT0110]MBR1318238.1 PAS domain-containing protein [Bradyrhizobium sp. U87765 SZCCT0109]MBR1351941.1 PAS domain-containing protein [Bradyrhizobium sp. U87765 SZCCT0048]
MALELSNDPHHPEPDLVEPARRSGSILLVLVVAAGVVAAAVGFMVLGRTQAQPYILGLLALLAMVGLFTLFAFAAGIVRFADRTTEDPVLRQIADHAFDGLAVTDSRGHIVYTNAAYLSLTGAAGPDDARPVERVFIGNPDVSEAVFRLLKAAREGKRLQEEVRVAGSDGAHGRWLRLRVRPLGEGKREARFTVWSIADITRDRERQEDVFQELQHAIEYLDHAPCGFFSVNPAGEVVYINATLANWLDHDLAEIGSGGLKLAEIVSGDGAALLTSIAAEPGAVKTETFDVDLRMRNGKTVPVRLYHKLAFGADGTPGTSRTLVINRARDEGPDPQRTAEVRFMRFFDHTPMAIATVDRSGAVARANARFAKLAQSLPGSANKSILAVVNERDRAALTAAIAKAAEGQGDIAPVEAMLDGPAERWGQFFVTAVEKDERDAEVAIVYMLETTEKRTLENRVTQQQKMEMVGQLAGGIAHDFNNVLSAIMMANDFLLNAHKPTDPSFQDIMQIKQNATRAATLVRQLLAFSRRQTLRPQVLDLGDALSDLTMLLRRLIGEKVKLDLVHGRDLWPVKVDVSQFEQVIVNLAVNARDAMPDGGKLSIRTANVVTAEAAKLPYKGMPAAEYVRIDVTDTGTGIPPEIVDKIFEPFFSTKEVGKGTGLGLSTVYGIVKQTGGFVYVDSEPGKGTSFRIFLPRHVVEAEPAVEPAAAATAAAPDAAGAAATPPKPRDLTGQGTILLVEDEDGLRALNARGLRSRGYTVLEAANGMEALDVLVEHNDAIDLVVSDVVMPEMDGPTMLKEMRGRNPELRIIFVSGYAEDAFARSLPENQQFAFLPKPFTLSQLVAQVKETMTAP